MPMQWQASGDCLRLQLQHAPDGHLTVQLCSSAMGHLLALIPHNFRFSQLVDLLNCWSSLTNGSVCFSDRDGNIMTVKNDEDLRQVYQYHGHVELQQRPIGNHAAVAATPELLHCLPSHTILWVCRQPLCTRHCIALAVPVSVSFAQLCALTCDLLILLGHSSSSSSSSSNNNNSQQALQGRQQLEMLLLHLQSGSLLESFAVSSDSEFQAVCQKLRADSHDGASLCLAPGDPPAASNAGFVKTAAITDGDASDGDSSSSDEESDSDTEDGGLSHRQWRLEDFDEGPRRVVLGNGQFGIVDRVTCKLTGEQVALKSINLCCLTDSGGSPDDYQVDCIMRELMLLSACRHENIVRYICSFVDRGRVYICTELMDCGSLDKLGVGDEAIVGYACRCIVDGLRFLWGKHILHRDVKLANILASRSGRVKLCDLGLAKQLEAYASGARTFCGSIDYMSPERINSRSYGHQADVWSLGVALYELAFGHRPFSRGRSGCLEQMISDIKLTPEPQLPPRYCDGALVTHQFRCFYHSCLKKNPDERLNKETIVQTEFYTMCNMTGAAVDSLRSHFQDWVNQRSQIN